MMQTVYDLINEGASMAMMESTSCSESREGAMFLFQEANHTLREIISDHPDLRHRAFDPSLVSLDVIPVRLPGQPGMNIFVCGSSSKNETNSDDQIIIEPCEVALSMAMLQYNMAVILQLQGEDDPMRVLGVEANQQLAYKLYCQCLQLLRPLSESHHGEDLTCVVRLTVASFYNMANLLFDMEMFEKASILASHGQTLLESNLLTRDSSTSTGAGTGGAQDSPPPPLFHNETMTAFLASSRFILHYGASPSHPAPAA